MKTLKTIGIILMVIIFPIGIVHCIFHTLGKEIKTFIGGISLLGIGYLLHMYYVEPQIFHDLFNKVMAYLPFINN